jgi:manganese/zinc-transporting P-type ATPase C
VKTRPISIRQDIPGRLRLHVPGLKAPGGHIAAVERLRGLQGMILVRVNPKCAALVLRYDPVELSRQQLMQRLRDVFPEASTGNGARKCALTASCSCHAGERTTTARELKRFAAISGVVGAVFARTTILGATVSQTLFSPLGLAVLVFSLPLARRGLRDLGRRPPSLDSFLAGGVLASVAGGQALTALEILWINSGADLLSTWIAEHSRKHISEILEITSHHTFVLVNGVEVEREVSQVRPDDVVVLHTGEKISVDGVIVHGEALLDESPISGRQESIFKRAGDEVLAGAFVQEGIIRVTAKRVGDDTYLARVMHKVQEALETRAPIEGVADRLASRLVRLGFGATLGTLLLTGSIWRAYTVLLIMACPCATVLAASTAVSAAMNAAARNRILIKGGRYLEEIGTCKTVFFDKTGTLTGTTPRLACSVGVNGVDEDTLLHLAASAETHNHHPLAQAILAEAGRRGLEPTPHGECDYHMGMGMRARLNGDEVLVGNTKLSRLYDAPLSPLAAEARAFQDQGLTVLFVHKNHRLQGLLGFAAQERPEAAAIIQRLRRLGVERVFLITGDEAASARQLSRRLGLEACHASVMPEEKADIVLAAAKRHGPVLMVGDGINDALALTRADVGVAFGTGGSEVAIEAADIALVNDDLEALVSVYALSHKTLRVAHENFWIATGSNILGVILGAAGLLSPVTAGLVHIAHSLGVLANSSRLLRLPATHFPEPTKTGASHGLQHPGESTELSDHQTPHPRQDQDRV